MLKERAMENEDEEKGGGGSKMCSIIRVLLSIIHTIPLARFNNMIYLRHKTKFKV